MQVRLDKALITRFEKALAQVARNERELEAERVSLESRAQKIRRLEDLIRAKEATGDRIVMGIAAALVVSAMALPVYAAFYSNGSLYLPSVGGSISGATSLVTERLQNMAPRASHDADMQIADVDPVQSRQTSRRRSGAEEPAFVHYVIHRATESAALIEGPSGLWWVTPGMTVPGAGRILSIDRSGAGWAVVTSEMTITEGTGAGILR